jgi:hypothetical protein
MAGGGIGGDGSGGSTAGVSGAGGTACNPGSGSVGPSFRPVSNSIVTADGGGKSSDLSCRRNVTSNSTPIPMWISSDIATASLIRRARRRPE